MRAELLNFKLLLVESFVKKSIVFSMVNAGRVHLLFTMHPDLSFFA